MALWPFGKKNKENNSESTVERDEAASGAAAPAHEDTDANASHSAGPVSEDYDIADRADSAAGLGVKAVAHDAVNGDMGPYDGDTVDIAEFNFEDFSVGLLDLGSMRIPLPKGSQVQVEMGQDGPRMLHILTPHLSLIHI